MADLARYLPAHAVETRVLSAFPTHGAVAPSITLHDDDWREARVRRVKNHLGDVAAYPSRRLERAIASQEPDLVHTNNLPGISTAVWEVCRRLGIPVVHTLHDYHLLCPRVSLLQPDGSPCRPHPLLCGLRSRRLARWGGAVANVIGVSSAILDLHAGFFRSASFHVVRHPARPSFTRELADPSTRLRTIGFIGALDVTKGVNVLLDAAPRIAELGCALRLAGVGALRKRIEAAAAESPAVRYDGLIRGPERESFFESCDVGIVPSLWAEPGGPPYTVLEWLAARRPVLISQRGGLAEAAGRHSGTIPIEPTADAIVAKLRELQQAADWRQALRSVRPVAARNDDERWLRAHIQIYEHATDAR